MVKNQQITSKIKLLRNAYVIYSYEFSDETKQFPNTNDAEPANDGRDGSATQPATRRHEQLSKLWIEVKCGQITMTEVKWGQMTMTEVKQPHSLLLLFLILFHKFHPFHCHTKHFQNTILKKSLTQFLQTNQMPAKNRTRLQRKQRATQVFSQAEDAKQPHSIVVSRGKVGKNLNQLMLDYRKVMSPYTGK